VNASFNVHQVPFDYDQFIFSLLSSSSPIDWLMIQLHLKKFEYICF